MSCVYGVFCRLVAGFIILLGVSGSVLAQDEGSMQVGDMTVTVGGGTAILDLPDVEFTKLVDGAFSVVRKQRDSDDFDDEIGWNVNGSISVPMAGATVSLNGFWAKIEDDNTTGCTANANVFCAWNELFDSATGGANQLSGNGQTATISSERDVDYWGASLESSWQFNKGSTSAAGTTPKRYLAIGADIRGIDQALSLNTDTPAFPGGSLSYEEDLDTTYYGAYVALGTDYSLPFLSGLTSAWGLQSSIMARVGFYYADTDYEGRYTDSSGGTQFTQSLSLSDNETAFIGGIVLETRKKISARSALSLKSEYEYYSYVPSMQYNDSDANNTGLSGPNNGTSIGSDDAYSARSMLRLTIGLGPDELYR